MTGPRRRLLIVTADDFGLTEGANAGILRAHETGVLTATTVLVNGLAAEAAGGLARAWPGLDVGLHVNLTLGTPSADASRVRSLLGPDGRLLPASELLPRALRRRVRGEEVRREVEAQIRRLRALGVEPTHWDAHQQAAFMPGLLGPTAAAAWDAGLRRARTPRMLAVAAPSDGGAGRRRRARHPARAVKDLYRAAAARRLARRFATPAWQVGPDMVRGGDPLERRWEVLLAGPPAGVTEAVSHPAVVDDQLRALVPDFADRRATDLAVLADPSLPDRLRDAGIAVIGFRDLPARGGVRTPR
jgi:chitin disaccharide deacetylase